MRHRLDIGTSAGIVRFVMISSSTGPRRAEGNKEARFEYSSKTVH
jgi:hypothetical protein